MIKAPIYNMEGKKTGDQTLSPGIFEITVKPEVVQSVVMAQLANHRTVVAHTKDRSEISGGGRKPWKQKGTGRARHGSIRSPLWRGGGITFGPRSDRNFTLKVNKKLKQQALRMTLSDKAAGQKIIVIDELKLGQIKTKTMAELFRTLGIESKKVADVKSKTGKSKASILMVMPKTEANVQASVRNLPRVSSIHANSLNVVDVLKHEWLVVSAASLPVIESTYGKA